MSNAKATVLQNAHALIERGELEAAQEILVPLLEAEANDAAVWWVYAHAVRDSNIGQAALQRVLELDASYPGARELKEDLDQIAAPQLLAEPLAAAAAMSAPHTEIDLDIDDWEDLQATVDTPQTKQSARIGTIVLVSALLLLIAAGTLVATGAIDINQLFAGLLPTPQPAIVLEGAPSQPGDDDSFSIGTALPQEDIAPDATAQGQETPSAEQGGQGDASQEDDTADVDSGAPAQTAEPSPTYAPLPAAVKGFVQAVAQQIESFTLDPEQALLLYTDAGNTLVLQSCAVSGTDFNAKVAATIQAVVALADEIPAELAAVAAGVLTCANPSGELRIIGSAVSQIRAFASGAINDRTFQGTWQQLARTASEANFAAEVARPSITAIATAQAPENQAEATAVLSATATSEPAPTADIAPPAAPEPGYVPLPRAESYFVQRVAQQIREFSLEPKLALLRDSDAGNTLVLQTCAMPGADFNFKVSSIMQTVVKLADEIPAELDAVAAGLLNCEDPAASLRIIGTEVRLIRDYVSGVIDDRAFQREWKQLG